MLELDQDDRVRDFTLRRTGAGAAPGQPDRRGNPAAGPAVRAGTALPHREAGGGGPADFGRGERTADAAGLHFGSGPARAGKGPSAAGAEREMSAIAAEAQKAAAWWRGWFPSPREQVEARPVAVSGLLRTLIEFREGDWKASGIRVRDLTRASRFRAGLAGAAGAGLSQPAGACRAVAGRGPQKVITIRTSVLAKRLVVEIAFSAPGGTPQAGRDGRRAGCHAQRDRGARRRGAADRKEPMRSRGSRWNCR